jgi:2,4-dienoyl-CoA reductase (NADPH2)
MVSMARPFLADPEFVRKAAEGRAAEIAPCIACNQACLDHTFQGKISTCLVNPRACFETELNLIPAAAPKKLAVVGAGPAGLSAALALDQCGHSVTLFDRAPAIGGQLNLARQIPGKEEFHGLVAWFETMLGKSGVILNLNAEVSAADMADFDEVVIATGVRPRDPGIPGQDAAHVFSYIDVLTRKVTAGSKVAIIGAGGIGFDVAEFLVQDGDSPTENLAEWLREWGVGDPEVVRGGLTTPEPEPSVRSVTLLQRKPEKPGRKLGKTTGWIHRATLQAKGVKMIGGVNYDRISPDGLHISFGASLENPTLLDVDSIVLCAGQESETSLAAELNEVGKIVHVIGGADLASELDAKRAIDQGTRLATRI